MRYLLQINITNKCNLNCSICYHSDKSNCKFISTENFRKIVADVTDYFSNYNIPVEVTISGGEPLLHQNFQELVKDAHEITKEKVFITTNGTLISKETLPESMKKHIGALQVSFDGSELKHNNVRGNKSFEKTIKNIDYAKKFNLHIQQVITKSTLNDLEDFFKLMKTIDPKSIAFRRQIPQGISKNKYYNILTPFRN